MSDEYTRNNSTQDAQIARLVVLTQSALERLSSLEATIKAWQIDIDRFYSNTMPRIEQGLMSIENRVAEMEKEMVGLKTKVAIIAAGIGAAITAGMSWVGKMFQ